MEIIFKSVHLNFIHVMKNLRCEKFVFYLYVTVTLLRGCPLIPGEVGEGGGLWWLCYVEDITACKLHLIILEIIKGIKFIKRLRAFIE
jgi:hypothetical protein